MSQFTPPLTAREISLCFPEYSNIQSISSGGQGSVFRGSHQGFGDCAIKIIFPDSEIRIKREIDALININHPNINKLLAFDRVEIRGKDCSFIISPFISGDDLQRHIRNSNLLSENEALQLLKEMALALDCLWVLRIVHRDVKPANILKRNDGVSILIDLGIARHLDRSTLTQPGHWLGTIGYMSPEQSLAQKNLTIKSDIFSLGITCYEALCGEHPFQHQQGLIMRGFNPNNASDIVICTPVLSDLLAHMMQHRAILRPLPNSIISLVNRVGV